MAMNTRGFACGFHRKHAAALVVGALTLFGAKLLGCGSSGSVDSGPVGNGSVSSGSVSSGSVSSGSAGGGEVTGDRCDAPSDCPQVPDPRCGHAACEDGFCKLVIEQGPIKSQIRGDCKVVMCSPAGLAEERVDPSDYYDDGNQCTMDYCKDAQRLNTAFPNGFVCPETKAGYCYKGGCEECIDSVNGAFCPQGYSCVGLLFCIQLEDEEFCSGDCGGVCAPCSPTYNCKLDSDCYYGVCKGGKCQAPKCDDGVKNGKETGVDCGVEGCSTTCSVGDGCAEGEDCTSGVCWAGKCQQPSCFDAVQNGGEVGVDCGGVCAPCL